VTSVVSAFVGGEGVEDIADLGQQVFDDSLASLSREALSLVKARSMGLRSGE